MAWSSPKTNWKATDKFNITDYNRIKNNIQWLYEMAVATVKSFSIIDMGEDLTDYSTYWDVDVFNAFEQNLETINQNTFNFHYGSAQTFYENTPFITYEELNRLEYAMLSMKTNFENQDTSKSLSFNLGRYKEVRP